MNEATKKRGRPRAFDEEEALAAIRDVFWSKGFARTSLDDLALATGVHRPSLYAAFGDKTQMYLRALEFFAQDLSRRFRAALFAGGSLREDLTGFFAALLDVHTSEARGCLVLTVSAGDAPALPDAQRFLDGTLRNIDQRIATRLGEDLGPERAARIAPILTSLVAGLAVRARGGEPRAELEAMVETAIALAVDSAQSAQSA